MGYQLVWIRKASLIVGSSQIAMSTVLTSFFLGLALGSLAVGKHWRSRRFSSLFVYGLFEAGIGLYALAFPMLYGGVEAAYGSLYGLAAGSGAALFLLRFALLFLLFLAPTFLMGGTLPLLLDGLVKRDAAVGSMTSLLYGLNIVGAVAGVLTAGYFAIPALGLNGTSLAAGVGNLTVAALALLVFRRRPPLHLPEPAGEASAGPGMFYNSLAAMSGFAAIGYQIAWARYFSLFKTASVYLTALLLAVYLAALAAGSMLMARLLASRVKPLRVVALLQPVAALMVLYGLSWWKLADYNLKATNFDIEPSWYFVSEVADTIFFAPLFQIGLVIFLPVLLLGTGLPGIIAAATRHSAQLRSSSGRLVFWNTIGASAGGFAAGYVLIPTFGLTGTLFSLTLVTLALGAMAEYRLGLDAGRSRKLGWGHLATAVVLVSAVLFIRNDVSRRAIGEYGIGRRLPEARLVDLVEGPLTTGTVFADSSSMYIASDDQIMAVVRKNELSVQAIQGHLPALFYPRPGTPQNILGIAVGSGQSFGALLRYPIEHMDVVDISSEMIHLAFTHFREYNQNLGGDPRVTVHLDDGRHFVQRAPDETYDVVTMEPPPPTAPGVHALYSFEFYRQVERVLRTDGVLMQWLPLYWMTPNETRGIVRTQAEVFPYTFVVRMGQIDFVTISFKRNQPPRINIEWIRQRAAVFAQEATVGRSRWTSRCRHGTASLVGILALITSGPLDIARMKTPYIYYDDDQRLSYSSGDRQLLRRYHDTTMSVLSFSVLPITPFEQLRRYFDGPLPAAEADEERARALLLYRVPSPSEVAAARARYNMSANPRERAEWALALADLNKYFFKESLSWIGQALRDNPGADTNWIGSWTRYHAYLHAGALEQWLDEIPEGLKKAPIVTSIGAELSAHLEAEARRTSAYLFSSP